MTNNLWSANSPQDFWLCNPNPSVEIWDDAIKKAVSILNLPVSINNIDTILENTLGEAQFGPNRYQLGLARHLYYQLKPLIPRPAVRLLRRVYSRLDKENDIRWPIEPRFAQFQWEVLRQVLLIAGMSKIYFRSFWPERKDYAFVLTHDVETAEGQKCVSILADLDESLGFRSSFNFVAARYPVDWGLIGDLCQRGFEIGVHGFKHDGKLFTSYDSFKKRAGRINECLNDFQSHGFRSPFMHRNPTWMQELDINYDLSFFDTDPYEPMPGGVMSIWPFMIGHFVELPYTLSQDHTLISILGETTPRRWLEKIKFIEKYHGMALVNVHPDYSSAGKSYQIYKSFLLEMKTYDEYWHALPRDVTGWWRSRSSPREQADDETFSIAQAVLTKDGKNIEIINAKDESLVEY